MSFVTTVVIISDSYGKEEEAQIAKLNKYITERYSDEVLFNKVEGSEHSAGTKYPQRSLYWGGFNYLDHDEFIELFRSINWGNSLLIMGHEDSDDGYIVVPSKTKLSMGRLGVTTINECAIEILTKAKF